MMSIHRNNCKLVLLRYLTDYKNTCITDFRKVNAYFLLKNFQKNLDISNHVYNFAVSSPASRL